LTNSALTLRSTASEERDKEVQILEVKEMPGASVIVGARQRHQLMVVIVSDAWAKWPDDQKREQLDALHHYGEPLGADTVVLVDSGGAQRGSATNSGVSLDPIAH